MRRLTKEKPETNVDTLLNFAFVKDGEAALRYADHEENIKLAEYIRKLANAEGCECSREDIIDGGLCSSAECDCAVAVLNTVAIQAAELRARLKAIEDVLGEEYDLERLKHLVTGDTFTEEDMSNAYTAGYETALKQPGVMAQAAERAAELCQTVMEAGLVEKAVAIAAANLVPVVRCKDCVHRRSRPHCAGRPMDWYCPEGVRRRDND